MESAGGDFPGTTLNTGYFRIRELHSGAVISSVSSSINHSFFSAAVDYSRDVVWVFGSAHNRVTRDAPCDTHEGCYMGIWHSSDLLAWTKGPALMRGSFDEFVPLNVDVDFVVVKRQQGEGEFPPSLLPAHQAVMMIEASPPYTPKSGHSQSRTFAINTGTDGDLSRDSDWVLLSANHSVESLAKTASSEVGACPSIRFDNETGYCASVDADQPASRAHR